MSPSARAASRSFELSPDDALQWGRCLHEHGRAALADLLRDLETLPFDARARGDLAVLRATLARHGELLHERPEGWPDLARDALVAVGRDPSWLDAARETGPLQLPLIAVLRAGRDTFTPRSDRGDVRRICVAGEFLAGLVGDELLLWARDSPEGQPLTFPHPRLAIARIEGTAARDDARVLVLDTESGATLFDAGTAEWGERTECRIEEPTIVAAGPAGGFAWGDASGKVEVWSGKDEDKVLAPAPAHGAAIRVLAVSPDGRWLASGGADGRVVLRDARTGDERARVEAHPGAVTDLAFTGKRGPGLVSAGTDGSIRLWSDELGREGLLAGHPGGTLALQWLPRRGRLLSGGADGSIRLWSLRDRERLAELVGESAIEALHAVEEDRKASGDTARFVGHRADGTVACWTVGGDATLREKPLGSVPSGRIREAVWHAALGVYVALDGGGRLASFPVRLTGNDPREPCRISRLASRRTRSS